MLETQNIIPCSPTVSLWDSQEEPQKKKSQPPKKNPQKDKNLKSEISDIPWSQKYPKSLFGYETVRGSYKKRVSLKQLQQNKNKTKNKTKKKQKSEINGQKSKIDGHTFEGKVTKKA